MRQGRTGDSRDALGAFPIKAFSLWGAPHNCQHENSREPLPRGKPCRYNRKQKGSLGKPQPYRKPRGYNQSQLPRRPALRTEAVEQVAAFADTALRSQD